MSAGEIISAHGLPTADTSNVYRVTQSSDASISIIMKGWRGSNNARRGNEQASGKKIDIPVKNVQRQPAARTFARVHMSVHVYGFVCEECRLESLKRLQANILHSLPSQFHRNCARSWPLVYPRARYFPVTFLIQFLLIYNLHPQRQPSQTSITKTYNECSPFASDNFLMKYWTQMMGCKCSLLNVLQSHISIGICRLQIR
jgi:hypothetical protein